MNEVGLHRREIETKLVVLEKAQEGLKVAGAPVIDRREPEKCGVTGLSFGSFSTGGPKTRSMSSRQISHLPPELQSTSACCGRHEWT